MSRVYTDTLEPRKPTQDITLGTSGETISVGANSINVNTVADKGGNTLWTSDGSGNLSSVNAGLKGNLVLLATQTADDVASIAFTTLIDSTYDVYIFKFFDVQPTSQAFGLSWQASSNGGSSYGMTITSAGFRSYNTEAGSSALQYWSQLSQNNVSNEQWLNYNLGETDPEVAVGQLYLFAPSSTTYVKHFYSRSVAYWYNAAAGDQYAGGYINSTSAVNAIRFSMYESTSSSQNIKNGTIKMYGLL